MTPQDMLEGLSEHGRSAFGDYHDGLDGWFGWGVKDGTLTITYQGTSDDGTGVAPVQAQWSLVPVATFSDGGVSTSNEDDE